MKKFIISVLFLVGVGFIIIKIGTALFGETFLSAISGKEIVATNEPKTKGERVALGILSIVNGKADLSSLVFLGTKVYEGQHYCTEYSAYEGRDIKSLCPNPYFQVKQRVHYYAKYDPYKAKPELMQYTEVLVKTLETPTGAQKMKGVVINGCSFINANTGDVNKDGHINADMTAGTTMMLLSICRNGYKETNSISIGDPENVLCFGCGPNIGWPTARFEFDKENTGEWEKYNKEAFETFWGTLEQ